MNYTGVRKGDQTGCGSCGGGCCGGLGFGHYQGRRATTTSSKFEGRKPKLKGHIFNYGDIRKAEAFYETMDEVLQHIWTNFKQGEELVRSLRAGLGLPPFQEQDPQIPTIQTMKLSKIYTAMRLNLMWNQRRCLRVTLKRHMG